ncbi:MAG: hypothetical protein JSV16_05240 [Candidatus Hydrogenedentota bacterium]|nr:MAG: hypothetical protein JSV16_05240 [Candidatus Hydrogenedentota bacterium]
MEKSRGRLKSPVQFEPGERERIHNRMFERVNPLARLLNYFNLTSGPFHSIGCNAGF